MTDTITLETRPVAQTGGWWVVDIEKIGINITVKTKDKYEYTGWLGTVVPTDQPIRLALPIYPGAGTQPEDTYTLINVEEQLAKYKASVLDSLAQKIKEDGRSTEGAW